MGAIGKFLKVVAKGAAKKVPKKVAQKAGGKCMKKAIFRTSKSLFSSAIKYVMPLFTGAILYKVYTASQTLLDSVVLNLGVLAFALTLIIVLYAAFYALQDLKTKTKN